MKLLFKNTTNYNSKNYNQFVKFHEKKFSFSYNFYNIVMLLLLLYCVSSTIIERKFLFTLIFSAMVALFIFIRIYWPIKRSEKSKEDYSDDKNTSFTFSFYKYYFVVNDTRCYYIKLYKVFETEDFFYLYIDEENAILIGKTGFEIGTPDEFSKFIKKKCFFKYSKQ